MTEKVNNPFNYYKYIPLTIIVIISFFNAYLYFGNQSLKKEIVYLSRTINLEREVRLGIPSIGTNLRPFILTTADGSKINSVSLAGRYLVLIFIKDNCPPCDQLLNMINTGQIQVKERNVDFFIISSNRLLDLQDYSSNRGLNLIISYDNDNILAKQFKISQYPCTVFINEDGVIEERKSGADSDIVEKIKEILA